MRIGEQLRFYQQGSPGVNDRLTHLDRLYTLLAELETRCGGKRRLADCRGSDGWPQLGVYFFFEVGEL